MRLVKAEQGTAECRLLGPCLYTPHTHARVRSIVVWGRVSSAVLLTSPTTGDALHHWHLRSRGRADTALCHTLLVEVGVTCQPPTAVKCSRHRMIEKFKAIEATAVPINSGLSLLSQKPHFSQDTTPGQACTSNQYKIHRAAIVRTWFFSMAPSFSLSSSPTTFLTLQGALLACSACDIPQAFIGV